MSVSLRVMGDNLDPEEVSRLLGTLPHLSHRKGDPNGRYDPRQTGMWSRRATDAFPGDINRQLFELFEPLSSHLDIWRDLSARFRTDVFCGVWLGDDGNVGLSILPDALKLIADRHLILDFDLYAIEPASQDIGGGSNS